MDRKPKPPPFPVGARVRYLGVRRVETGDGATILAPGMEVVIAAVDAGRRGTDRTERVYGEEVVDHTVDGYSVYVAPAGPEWRRIIWPKNRSEWALISAPASDESRR